jgi:hypothetical protein
MDSEKVHTIVASNFQRSYRERSKEIKEIRLMPKQVRELIEQTHLALRG